MKQKIVYVYVPYSRYPESCQHIIDIMAIRTRKGLINIFKVERKHKNSRRRTALRGYGSISGYDRDEFPMALFEEGGQNSDVRYISPSDNRGAGSYIGNRLRNYPDGTRIILIISR